MVAWVLFTAAILDPILAVVVLATVWLTKRSGWPFRFACAVIVGTLVRAFILSTSHALPEPAWSYALGAVASFIWCSIYFVVRNGGA